MHHHRSTHPCPVIEPFGRAQRHIDAAVTHRPPEVVVPVRAVDGVSFVEEHHVGHVGQVVAVPSGAAAHPLRLILGIHSEGALHGRVFGRA